MLLNSFMKLCKILHPFINLNKQKSRNRTGKEPITTEWIVHCLVRYLAGGTAHDIRDKAKVNKPSFYRLLHLGLDAVLKAPELQIKLPQTERELNSAALEWQKGSTKGVIDGCVGCIDGYVLITDCPTKNETDNAKAYFSGHKNHFGINIQAACDAKYRFISVCAASPGSSNDIMAYRRDPLSDYIEKLPKGKYFIGDNAYLCTETLITPFAGSQKHDLLKSSYSYQVSKLRIRVENTFGRLVKRLSIFKRSLLGSVVQ